MRLIYFFTLVCLVAIIHADAHRSRPHRPRQPRHRALQNRQRSQSLLEATFGRLRNLRVDDNNKIKIKLPKFTLKKIQKRRRVRPRRPNRGRNQRPRLNRDAPVAAKAEPIEEQPVAADVIYVDEIEGPVEPPPPPPPQTYTRYTYKTTTPKEPETSDSSPKPLSGNLVYQSEPSAPTKIFKFQPSEAKPNNPYFKTPPSTIATPSPPPAKLREEPAPATTSLESSYPAKLEEPFYFNLPTTETIYQGQEIFPEDITNTLSEFDAVVGSDDIGQISPFSYFSSPVFVGNKVQYLADEIPAQQAKSLPTVEISPKVAEILTPEEAVLPEVPDESSRFFTSDEVYYSSESQEAPDEDEEEIVFYYKDIEPAEAPTPKEDSVSYPLYPPLAPAPPLVGHSSTTSPDLFKEVPTPPDSQYKRENTVDPSPLNLVSKSAYTSNDLLDDTPISQYDISDEPEILQTPDGETFYFVGEVSDEQDEVKPPVPQDIPSPVYFKYPKESLAPTPAPTQHLPEPQKVVYYRQEDVAITTKPPPPPKPKFTYKTTTPKKLETEGTTNKSYGVVYPQRRITSTESEKVSISTEKPTAQKSTYSIFNDITSSSPQIEEKEGKSNAQPKSLNQMSFGFPDGSTKFEIPQEFRTFLNTPPKWINMENW